MHLLSQKKTTKEIKMKNNRGKNEKQNAKQYIDKIEKEDSVVADETTHNNCAIRMYTVCKALLLVFREERDKLYCLPPERFHYTSTSI